MGEGYKDALLPFQVNWRRQNAVIFMLTEPITQGNETIIDNYKEIFVYLKY